MVCGNGNIITNNHKEFIAEGRRQKAEGRRQKGKLHGDSQRPATRVSYNPNQF
ncbi:MAG: hypothetical protein F6K39_38435 [Okeania sp. SIO3B3]|nr:hypothetical protein [Okeania sp. SIO3B3]